MPGRGGVHRNCKALDPPLRRAKSLTNRLKDCLTRHAVLGRRRADWPIVADSDLTQCNMTALNCGGQRADTRIGPQRSWRIGTVKFAETQISVRKASSGYRVSDGFRYF